MRGLLKHKMHTGANVNPYWMVGLTMYNCTCRYVTSSELLHLLGQETQNKQRDTSRREDNYVWWIPNDYIIIIVNNLNAVCWFEESKKLLVKWIFIWKNNVHLFIELETRNWVFCIVEKKSNKSKHLHTYRFFLLSVLFMMLLLFLCCRAINHFSNLCSYAHTHR